MRGARMHPPAPMPATAEAEVAEVLAWGNSPYDNKTIAEVVHDYAVIRGDLTEQYARDQLVNVIERRVARHAALAAQAALDEVERRLEAASNAAEYGIAASALKDAVEVIREVRAHYGTNARCGEQFARHPSRPELVAVCTLPPNHGGDHDNVLPKTGVPRASAAIPAAVPAVNQVERCPRCGHMPHNYPCLNMASDNDCSCPGVPAIPDAVREGGEGRG